MSVTITERQKRYAKLSAKNLKDKNPKTKKELMIEAGFSPSRAINPHEVENSKNYQEYFRKEIGEETLKDIHKKLLNAGTLKREYFAASVNDEEIKDIVEGSGLKLIKILKEKVPFKGNVKTAYCKLPALDVIVRSSDMAYKVLGSYAPEKKEIKTLNINSLIKKLDNGESFDDEDED